ncbi:hypothetical protein Hanom_Chr04g00293601 [Helianthus anomalus]
MRRFPSLWWLICSFGVINLRWMATMGRFLFNWWLMHGWEVMIRWFATLIRWFVAFIGWFFHSFNVGLWLWVVVVWGLRGLMFRWKAMLWWFYCIRSVKWSLIMF